MSKKTKIHDAVVKLLRNGDLVNDDQVAGFELAASMLNLAEVHKLADKAHRMLIKGIKEMNKELFD